MKKRLGGFTGTAVALALLVGVTPATAQKFSSPADGAAKEGTVVTPAGITLPSGLYDESADAVKDINRARDRAKRDNRNVVIMWGENNCEFCVHLYRLYSDDPRIKQLMQTEFELVKVNIGKFDKNIELARDLYQTNLKELGAPDLTIVNPATNQAIAILPGKDALAKPMTMARIFDPDYVFNFLLRNKPAPRPAVPIMMEAQQKARRDEKRLLVYFNVYGSDACAAWDRIAAAPGVSAILDKAFIVRKLDIDRNPGGSELLNRLKGGAAASPPWMTIVDPDGKPVPDAGTGHEFDPAATLPAAIDWLVAASGGKLGPDDRTTLLSQATAAMSADEHAPAAGVAK